LRQRKTRRHVAEYHPHAGADADLPHQLGRRQLAVGGREIADNAQRFVRSRLALLRVEIDEQDQIRRLAAEGWLDCVVHLAVGMHRPPPLDFPPARIECGTPRAGSGWRVAQSAALGAGLQVKVVLGAVAKIFEVLDVEIVDGEPHPKVFAANSHFLLLP
jgi:hypothetical protein